MKHLCDVDVAIKYGVEVSIFLENISFLIKHNYSNDKNFHEGRYWTYNTQEAMIDFFPYWSRDQIKRIIKKAFDSNLLLKGNFNKLAYDRTTWFSLTDYGHDLYGLTLGRNSPKEKTITPNVLGDNAQPIPDINHIQTQIQDKRSCPTDVERPGFEKFWSLYPRKENKKGTLKIWISKGIEKNAEEIEHHLMKRLEGEWKSKDKQYIPMPTTFLNGERWKDDLTEQSQAQSKPLKHIDIQHKLMERAINAQIRERNQSQPTVSKLSLVDGQLVF